MGFSEVNTISGGSFLKISQRKTEQSAPVSTTLKVFKGPKCTVATGVAGWISGRFPGFIVAKATSRGPSLTRFLDTLGKNTIQPDVRALVHRLIDELQADSAGLEEKPSDSLLEDGTQKQYLDLDRCL